MIGRFPAHLVDEKAIIPKRKVRPVKHEPTHRTRIISRCVDCNAVTLRSCTNSRCFTTIRTTRGKLPHKCAIALTKSEGGYIMREARRIFAGM